MDVAFHLAGPLQKAPQFHTLAPDEFPEFQETDLRHFYAGVGFDAPQQVGAPPRGQAMAFGGIPQKAELGAHGAIITTKRLAYTGEKLPGCARRTAGGGCPYILHVRIQALLGISTNV